MGWMERLLRQGAEHAARVRPPTPPAAQGVLKGLARQQVGVPEAPSEVATTVQIEQPPPPEAWQRSGVSYPPMSLKDAVARWYSKTGGADQAIDSSQKALAEYEPTGWDSLYGKWSRADAERLVPITEDPSLPEGTDGQWKTNGPFDSGVLLNPASRSNALATAEHELTHAALLPAKSMTGLIGAGRASDAFTPITWEKPERLKETIARVQQSHADWLRSRGVAEDVVSRAMAGYDDPNAHLHYEYLSQPAEIDPRLAEIRRRFEFSTGVPVRSEGDAKAALNWWMNTGRHQWHDAVDPSNAPTMSHRAFDLYARYPDDLRQALVRRLPQVFAVPAAIGLGAAAQQEQPGAQSGAQSR